jgi:hypothetical protein
VAPAPEPEVAPATEPEVAPAEEPAPEPEVAPAVEPAPEPDEDCIEYPEIYNDESKPQEFVVENTMIVPPANTIPKLIFIIPFRDRHTQRTHFIEHMKVILEDYNRSDYEFYFIHQTDKRTFNRGALKNIGFLFVKNKYPNDYKNITLVFNDVDTMPQHKNTIQYETTKGVVKHFYGYVHTLGGIVSINAGDFEETNGFPNYWAWGYEDNALNNRVLHKNLKIDRSTFFKIMDKTILHLLDGFDRHVNRGEFDRYKNEVLTKNHEDGITTIYDLKYELDTTHNFVNVNAFNTKYDIDHTFSKIHDIRKGNIPFRTKNRRGARMPMLFH